MKLVYSDPHSSGLSVVDCPSEADIEKVLAKHGMDEDQCGGDTVPYVFIQQDGKTVRGKLDFT